jgi:hypothetical protein
MFNLQELVKRKHTDCCYESKRENAKHSLAATPAIYHRVSELGQSRTVLALNITTHEIYTERFRMSPYFEGVSWIVQFWTRT